MKKLIVLCCGLMLLGCSSSDRKTAEMPKPVQSAQPAAAMPFSVSIAEAQGEETAVTVTVSYQIALDAAPVLVITPKNDTQIPGAELTQTLPVPEKAGTWSTTLVLKGENPAIDVSVRQTGESFGMESHASWPKITEKMTRKHVADTDVRPLPAPIEVNGVEVTEGVEVHR